MIGFWNRPQGPYATGPARMVSGPATVAIESDETALIIKRRPWETPPADRAGDLAKPIDVCFEAQEWD